MKKITTQAAKVSIMLLDDCIQANLITEAEAYWMLKKHVFKVKSKLIIKDGVTPPFYKRIKYK